MSNLICPICQKLCKSSNGLRTHIERAHGTDEQKAKYKLISLNKIICSCIVCKKEIYKEYLTSHYKSHLNQKVYICLQCGKEHDKNQDFCCHSCAASFNNNIRKEQNKTTKGKVRTLICIKCNTEYTGSIHTPKEKSICIQCKPKKKKRVIKEKLFKSKILGLFSKICYCTCKHCGKQFIDKTQKQYCSEHYNYSSNKRSFYKFKFNVFNFPDLFDLELLKEVGFYAPGGKSGKWNINGLSRDHKLSIAEAIKNNYDPYYISHPLNCQLIPHIENNKKKSKSSITYEKLKELVDKFDSEIPQI